MNKQGWTYKKLGEICDKGSSNIAQNKIIDIDGDYPVYGASGFVQNVDFYHRDTPYIGIVKDGSGVGRVNIYPAYSSLLGTMQYIIPRDGYLLGYVAYALKGLNLSSFASGAAIPHIYFKDYSKCKISVPPFAEQERIVEELDLLQGIIEKKKEQLKAYDQLAQSIFYDMFGDPIDNPKGWEVKKLKEVISVRGRVGWKGYKKEDLRESGPLAIGGGHIMENGSLDFSSPVFLSIEKYEESPEIMVQRGDLIMVQRGTIGRIGLVKNEIGDATINPCVLILRPISVNELYLLHLFLNKDMQNCLTKLVRGVAQPMITQKQVNSLDIPLPPLSLQEEFAEKVEAIERQKALVQRSIEETQTMFDYTMDKYFG